MEIFRLLIAARFVCAITKTNTKFATLLRSYETSYHDPLLGECKIWEACQATSAATTFFEPIVLGPYEQVFADGAVLYNNSIQLVHREAAELWPDRIQDAGQIPAKFIKELRLEAPSVPSSQLYAAFNRF